MQSASGSTAPLSLYVSLYIFGWLFQAGSTTANPDCGPKCEGAQAYHLASNRE